MRGFIVFSIFLLFSPEVSLQSSTKDCGKTDRSVIFQSCSLSPDPILYPGNVSITASLDIIKDFPGSGLQLSLNLTKLEPKTMHVPCFQGIGSCQYDVCKMLTEHPEKFCPMFPPGVKCECPIRTGHYSMKNVGVQLPDLGEIFAKILKGNYIGNMTLTDLNNGKEIGCMQATFAIKPRE